MTVLSPFETFDPRIPARILLDQFPDLWIGRSIINQTQLPVRVELFPDGFDGALQPFGSWVVNRNQDRKKRLTPELSDMRSNSGSILVGEPIVQPDPGCIVADRLAEVIPPRPKKRPTNSVLEKRFPAPACISSFQNQRCRKARQN